MKYRFEICFTPSKGSKIRTVSKVQYDTSKLALAEAYNKIKSLVDKNPYKECCGIGIVLKML